MNHITANTDTLMRQAPDTADFYLASAITSIEKRFGKGSAAGHPELLAALVNASAIDFGASVIARALETTAEAISQHE